MGKACMPSGALWQRPCTLHSAPRPAQASQHMLHVQHRSALLTYPTSPLPRWQVTAWCEDGTIMAVRHKQFPHIQVGWCCRAGFLPFSWLGPLPR